MRYQKTINVWEPGVQERIASGDIKVQRGQWMTCGLDNPKRCRFVSLDLSGRIHVVHWQGSPKATREHFHNCVQAMRKR